MRLNTIGTMWLISLNKVRASNKTLVKNISTLHKTYKKKNNLNHHKNSSNMRCIIMKRRWRMWYTKMNWAVVGSSQPLNWKMRILIGTLFKNHHRIKFKSNLRINNMKRKVVSTLIDRKSDSFNILFYKYHES